MKKIIIYIIVIITMFTYSYATVENDSADILVRMKLMSGYPDGTLKLEKNITRAEFCTLVTKMLGYNENPIKITTKTVFKDMKKTHWAYDSVMTATQMGFLSGYEDETFRPSNNITYAECCSILVNVLGYKSKLEGKWPDNVTSMAEKLKLNTNIKAETSEKMTRGKVAVMLVNALDVSINN